MTHKPKKETKLPGFVGVVEHVVYYGLSGVLVIAIGMLFIDIVESMLRAAETGLLQTTITLLDQALLILIFVELLNTIGIVVQQREVVAEPFLLVGMVAVVRRILSATAEAEQALGTEKFQALAIELGVLAGLVVALSIALYITRRTTRQE